ncbi:MAG: PAS domain S-box protein, partial [Desulfobacterales bacterium]
MSVFSIGGIGGIASMAERQNSDNPDIEDTDTQSVDQERLAIAVENTAEAIVITDTSGNIQYVNPAFEAITGYSLAEVLAQNI